MGDISNERKQEALAEIRKRLEAKGLTFEGDTWTVLTGLEDVPKVGLYIRVDVWGSARNKPNQRLYIRVGGWRGEKFHDRKKGGFDYDAIVEYVYNYVQREIEKTRASRKAAVAYSHYQEIANRLGDEYGLLDYDVQTHSDGVTIRATLRAADEAQARRMIEFALAERLLKPDTRTFEELHAALERVRESWDHYTKPLRNLKGGWPTLTRYTKDGYAAEEGWRLDSPALGVWEVPCCTGTAVFRVLGQMAQKAREVLAQQKIAAKEAATP